MANNVVIVMWANILPKLSVEIENTVFITKLLNFIAGDFTVPVPLGQNYLNREASVTSGAKLELREEVGFIKNASIAGLVKLLPEGSESIPQEIEEAATKGQL
ncbi:hypothetical protein NQ317_002267 [Molorchus minor]|uniref:Uncharacterized protein n=1 Tax=Molorchus minor TaxID=1323400 RepID=A0ABQ9JY28_9CUCU|nr:hypothetical protein NQ317_002267 [Molorchus minor]